MKAIYQYPKLLAFFVLYFYLTTSIFIPTDIHCGTKNDVKAVSKFPYSIPSSHDKTSPLYNVRTWNNPKPTNNYTLLVDGQVVQYMVENYRFLRERNSLNISQIYSSFDLQNMIFDVSTTQLPECAGFYLRANLSNGAILEYSWYMQYEDESIEYGETTYNLTSGQTRQYFLVNNFEFSTNHSAIGMAVIFKFGSPIPPAPSSAWELTLGEPPYIGENNAAPISYIMSPLVPKTKRHGYMISSTSYNVTMPYTPLKNGIEPTPMIISGAANELNGDLEILSLDADDIYVGSFSPGDSVLYMKMFSFAADFEVGGGSVACELVIPSVKLMLLSIIIFVGLFH